MFYPLIIKNIVGCLLLTLIANGPEYVHWTAGPGLTTKSKFEYDMK